MATTEINKKIRVSDLDYLDIRNNLIEFFKGQDTFKDYNFEGSALSILIDVLAYNTHYNALYNNLAINEMFLDSASKRSSVLSIANNFSYTPRSVRCSKAVVSLLTRAASSNPAPAISVRKYTPFSTNLEGKRYVFYTLKDYSVNLDLTEYGYFGYYFPEIEIFEGTPVTLKFICTKQSQKFIIPNRNIDLDTISVILQDTSESTGYQTFYRAQEILNLNDTSKVYFIKELEDGRYEISFGRNNFGVPIVPGNIVTITGLETKYNSQADFARQFTYQGSLLPGQAVVTTREISTGGADKETLDEIKDNVTKFFFNQHRAVTDFDYQSIIQKNFDGIDDIRVWGGEDNTPPVYGKVFACIKPERGNILDSDEKTAISKMIAPYSIVTTGIEFVDPKYIELEINTTVYYDSNATLRSPDNIKIDVVNQIEAYRQEQLQKFSGVFRFSKFTSMIDRIDPSIQSNITRIRLFVPAEPVFGSNEYYEFDLVNPIFTSGQPTESLISTGFYIAENDTVVHYIDDDGLGNLRLFYYKSIEGSNTNKYIVDDSIGTVDYRKGSIRINRINIIGLASNDFYFIIKPLSNDVISVRNYIVDIPQTRVSVNMISSTATKNMIDYQFTSSRT